MRRDGRRSSGGSLKEAWRRCASNAAPSVKESTGGVMTGTTGGVCKSSMNVARSGAVAFGKEVSRHTSASGESLVSIDEEAASWSWCSALSRAQVETQAANSHKKVSGRASAISLLSGKREVNTAKIIHIRPAQSHASDQGQAVLFRAWI